MIISDITFVLSISYHQYEFVTLSFVKQLLTQYLRLLCCRVYYWFTCHHLHLILVTVSVITYALCVFHLVTPCLVLVGLSSLSCLVLIGTSVITYVVLTGRRVITYIWFLLLCHHLLFILVLRTIT